jgi:hypothetical protein
MSQPLPARPDLDHLRKQAKARLDDLRRHDSEAKLADALHLIAREYGFASWPKLKVHVRALSEAGAARTAVSPFTGRWVADITRSTRHPANQFQRAVMDFSVADDTVRITHGYIDESGRREHGAITVQADGRERVGDNGYGLTATWRGANLFETVATKDGEVVGRGSYEVSADGGTLTIVGPEQVIALTKE